MIFTGDHLNDPKQIENLVSDRTMSRARANFLNTMPLQKVDLLLHEAGVPPIHTPLSVLEALPESVKSHLFVVHTSNLPEDCTLRMAPTGTAGTIRLDSSTSRPSANTQLSPFSPHASPPRVDPTMLNLRKSLQKNDSMYQDSADVATFNKRRSATSVHSATSQASSGERSATSTAGSITPVLRTSCPPSMNEHTPPSPLNPPSNLFYSMRNVEVSSFAFLFSVFFDFFIRFLHFSGTSATSHSHPVSNCRLAIGSTQ